MCRYRGQNRTEFPSRSPFVTGGRILNQGVCPAEVNTDTIMRGIYGDYIGIVCLRFSPSIGLRG